MANVIKDGLAWMAAKLKAYASDAVTITDGTNSISGVLATIGKTEWEYEDESGVVDRMETRDFLIDATDLDFGSGPVLPKRGMKIVEVIGTVTFTRTVASPPGLSFWDHDGYYGKLRIRTWDRLNERT